MQNSLPADAALPELYRALNERGRAIFSASPGSGKTTRIPLALAGLLPGALAAPLPGKILVLEPRRLAARAAARYMARLLGEEAGQRVGYRVRLESRVSKATRVELLTEGMFTRRLLADPELAGVSCVIFDEFHERSLQGDLGLALCLESAAVFRPDLKLLVMSATLQTEELSRFLGHCPVVRAGGRSWPVELRYAAPSQSIGPASSLEDIAVKSARAVHAALAGEAGSILVFLPGQAEIRRCSELLGKLPEGTNLYPLYGDLAPREQDAAIAPPPPGRRKVVLATDIAQTSLTIEGVRVVIDAGLARGPRFEPATGLSRLVTTRLTQDAADQRAGRAGRLEAGLCLRLWPADELLFPAARPEILDADLTPLYLDALLWGSEPAALPWLTPPPAPTLEHAAKTLLGLEAARPAQPGSSPAPRLCITAHGQKLSRLPLHPRLAHMVLRAAGLEGDLSSLAACLAAIVSERDPVRKGAAGEAGADIRLRLPLLKKPENKRLRDAAAQIHRLSGLKSAFGLPEAQEEVFCGPLLSLVWPERIAQRRGPGSFRLASGQGAELAAHDPLGAEPWLAAASLGGGQNRRLHLAAPLALADILRLHGAQAQSEEQVYWDVRSEAVIRRSVKRLGALILEEKPLPPAPQEDCRGKRAVLEGIVALGLQALPWTDDLRQLQARVFMLRSLEGDTWPDLCDAALLQALKDALATAPKDAPGARTGAAPQNGQGEGADGGPSGEPGSGPSGRLNAGSGAGPQEAWLAPWLNGVSRRSQFAGIDLGAALAALLPWPLPKRLAEEAPQRLGLPSGSSARLDYLPALRGEPPVLAVKLQEMFGQTDTPRLAGGRAPVMLHLLSPAGRPLQVTADLRHFWQNAYAGVRAEMRGRYPRHPWPENPLKAAPTGKTKKRLSAQAKK